MSDELVLRQVGEHFEIISNGVFLMDTRNGESERLLVTAALAGCERPERMLIGGLGVGFSLAQAVRDERLRSITVVELEPAVIEWNHTVLRRVNDDAVDDPRVSIVEMNLLDFLDSSVDQYDAICVDIDNGPDWTVTSANQELYGDRGTGLLVRRLKPDGVLAVWSAAASAHYEETLRRHLDHVEVLEVPVPRGEPDVIFLGAGPKMISDLGSAP